MIGILVQLLISWALLKFIEHKNLDALGFRPSAERVKDFLLGLVIPLAYYAALFLLLAYWGGNPWRLNPGYAASQFWASLWYLFKSVAFETLIFNGALLYILIRRIGVQKGIIVTAIGFGIYHWFSWNLFGHPLPMMIVFLTTGIMGYLWSMAFYVTGSIYLPFALHLGVDIAMGIVFSKDRGMGPQLLTQTYVRDPYTPGMGLVIIGMILYFIGFPLVTYLYLRKKQQRATRLART